MLNRKRVVNRNSRSRLKVKRKNRGKIDRNKDQTSQSIIRKKTISKAQGVRKWKIKQICRRNQSRRIIDQGHRKN